LQAVLAALTASAGIVLPLAVPCFASWDFMHQVVARPGWLFFGQAALASCSLLLANRVRMFSFMRVLCAPRLLFPAMALGWLPLVGLDFAEQARDAERDREAAVRVEHDRQLVEGERKRNASTQQREADYRAFLNAMISFRSYLPELLAFCVHDQRDLECKRKYESFNATYFSTSWTGSAFLEVLLREKCDPRPQDPLRALSCSIVAQSDRSMDQSYRNFERVYLPGRAADAGSDDHRICMAAEKLFWDGRRTACAARLLYLDEPPHISDDPMSCVSALQGGAHEDWTKWGCDPPSTSQR
jgi:hypothetical protein